MPDVRLNSRGRRISNSKQISNETFLLACNALTNYKNYDFSNTKYVNIRTPVTVTCNLHGTFFKMPVSILKSCLGCNVCESLNGHVIRLSVNEYKQVASILHNNKYDYASVIDWPITANDKITVTCQKHGQFQIRKSAHISASQLYGCQKCGRGYSRNEEIIEQWLVDHNVTYVYQKRFSDLIGGRRQPLPYDFFFPDYNLILEFDGAHHSKLVKFGKNQSVESQKIKFEQIKTNDGIKIEYAFDNNINMLRISYLRAKEISYILNFELFGIDSKMITDTPVVTECRDKSVTTTKLIGYF